METKKINNIRKCPREERKYSKYEQIEIDGGQIKIDGGSHQSIKGAIARAPDAFCRPHPLYESILFMGILIKISVVEYRRNNKMHCNML
jgi:hypothetical protein